jgi:hypothetical protein
VTGRGVEAFVEADGHGIAGFFADGLRMSALTGSSKNSTDSGQTRYVTPLRM